MAPQQQVILRRHSHGVAHEGRGVEGQGGGHAAGYSISAVVSNRPMVVFESLRADV